MLRPAARLLRKIFAPPFDRRRGSVRPGVVFRPRVELLEGRTVPALRTWTGAVSTSFDTAGNWAGNAVPAAGDDIVFAPRAVPATEEVSAHSVSVNSTGMHGPSSGAYNSVTLSITYIGTVTLSSGFETGDFTLANGAISQPSSGTDITVSDEFTWTYGTLNSSSHLSTVYLDGATATIMPEDGGTIELGSSLELINGAIATLGEGTIDTTDGVGFVVGANSEMNVAPGQGNSCKVQVDGTVTQGNPTLIDEGGVVTVLSGRWNMGLGSLVNHGGSFVLQSNTSAVFGTPVPGLNANWTFIQAYGATYIAADATVESTGDMYMGGGFISIKRGAKPANFDGNVVLGTGATFEINGGSIVFDNAGATARTWSTFLVEGDVKWTSGVYYPSVDATSSGDAADLWKVTGTFSVRNNAAVTPKALDAQGDEVNPPGNTEWRLFISDTKIETIDGYTDPILPTGWTFDKDTSNPSKWWNLKTS